MTNSPRFTHDCDNCTYLDTTNEGDLYHCIQSWFGPTIVLRYSNDGSDYSSGLPTSENEHAFPAVMRFGKMLAEARGLDVTPPVFEQEIDETPLTEQEWEEFCESLSAGGNN